MSSSTPSVADLAALAAELAPRSEGERRLAPELVTALADAGLFRLCVPEALGGLEASPRMLVEVVEALAFGDGSAGWCVAIGATSGLLAGYLPEHAARDVYARPNSILGGVFAPKGEAVPAGSGFKVSGRWPFASGCGHCDWLMGGCLVRDHGELRTLPSGMPDVRLMLAPAAEVKIHDTWHVAGLRGTGSHDIEFDDLVVRDGYSASVLSDAPVCAGPLYRFPLFGLLAIAIAAVNLGVARGALDELGELAGRKTPTASRRRLAERPTAQAEFARAQAGLRAARALLLEAVEEAWEIAGDRGEVPVAQRAWLRLAASHATGAAAQAAHSAYLLGGGSAIYDTSPLQRRFRDANVATQHMLVAPATWELCGRLLFGLPTDTDQL